MNRRGFSLYLTFLVTTVVFMLVTGSQEISRMALDLSRSDAVDTLVFHAADGGLERGLAKLRQSFAPFTMDYSSTLNQNRQLLVKVVAEKQGEIINLKASAILYEGKRKISTRSLARLEINNQPGRAGSGRFVEAT